MLRSTTSNYVELSQSTACQTHMVKLERIVLSTRFDLDQMQWRLITNPNGPRPCRSLKNFLPSYIDQISRFDLVLLPTWSKRMVEKCEYLSLVNSFDSDNLRLEKPKKCLIYSDLHMRLLFLFGVYSQPGKELKAFTKADAAVASDLARRKDMALHKDKAWYWVLNLHSPTWWMPTCIHTQVPGTPTKKNACLLEAIICWKGPGGCFLFDLEFVDLLYITFPLPVNDILWGGRWNLFTCHAAN